MNVPTLLTTIRLLMAHPNGDDGLMPDIVSPCGRVGTVREFCLCAFCCSTCGWKQQRVAPGFTHQRHAARARSFCALVLFFFAWRCLLLIP